MKFRRKNTAVEAWYYNGDIGTVFASAPHWVVATTSIVFIDKLVCRTAMGAADAPGPCWLIKEPLGDGCYPCPIETFELNYEPMHEA